MLPTDCALPFIGVSYTDPKSSLSSPSSCKHRVRKHSLRLPLRNRSLRRHLSTSTQPLFDGRKQLLAGGSRQIIPPALNDIQCEVARDRDPSVALKKERF